MAHTALAHTALRGAALAHATLAHTALRGSTLAHTALRGSTLAHTALRGSTLAVTALRGSTLAVTTRTSAAGVVAAIISGGIITAGRDGHRGKHGQSEERSEASRGFLMVGEHTTCRHENAYTVNQRLSWCADDTALPAALRGARGPLGTVEHRC